MRTGQPRHRFSHGENLLIGKVALNCYGPGYNPSRHLLRERRRYPGLDAVIDRHGAASVSQRWSDFLSAVRTDRVERRGVSRDVRSVVRELAGEPAPHVRTEGTPMEIPQPGSLTSATDTEVLSDSRATVARVSYVIPAARVYLTGTGSAWRERSDAPDPVTGELLASARALRVLAARMERMAGGRVREADAIRAHREKRAAEKAAEIADAAPVIAGGKMGDPPFRPDRQLHVRKPREESR